MNPKRLFNDIREGVRALQVSAPPLLFEELRLAPFPESTPSPDIHSRGQLKSSTRYHSETQLDGSKLSLKASSINERLRVNLTGTDNHLVGKTAWLTLCGDGNADDDDVVTVKIEFKKGEVFACVANADFGSLTELRKKVGANPRWIYHPPVTATPDDSSNEN